MKKRLFAVISIVLCLSALFTACSSSGGDVVTGGVSEQGYEKDEAHINGDDAIIDSGSPVKSDVEIEEGEEVSEANLGTEVNVFINSKYFIEGKIYSQDSMMPVKLATDGKNLELTATVEGISLGVLVLDDKTYIVNPAASVYTELNETLIQALGIDDLDLSEFQSIRNGDDSEKPAVKQNAVSINGEPGLCTDYVYSDTSVKLYSVGNKLIQVEDYDKDGTLTMQIVVDSITDQIPSSQLTLKGMTEQNVSQFIQSFVDTVAKQGGFN